MNMTSNRPYIIRALYEWIVDNDCTPYILVDSHWPGIMLPPQFEGEDKIIFNISPIAIRELNITNEHTSFMARFDNQTQTLNIPMGATLAIYAQENGQGMVFDPEPYPEVSEQDKSLSVVADIHENATTSSQLSDTPDNKNKPVKGKPTLKVIK